MIQGIFKKCNRITAGDTDDEDNADGLEESGGMIAQSTTKEALDR